MAAVQKDMVDGYRQALHTIFDSDSSQYPKTIEWDSGDPNPDLNTKGKCTIETTGLIVIHKTDLLFQVTRLFTADCSTTASIHPQGPRACRDKDLVTLGVLVDIEKGKIIFKHHPRVDASRNSCLNGTRGQSMVSLFFNSFVGFDISP